MSAGNIPATDPTFDYPKYYKFAWATALNNVEPSTTPEWNDYKNTMGSMVLSQKLQQASSDSAGNPYAAAEAVDPEEQLGLVQQSQDMLQELVDQLGDGDLTDAMTLAAAAYDAHASTANIESVISSTEQASLSDHLDNVGRVNASLWAARAMMGSQAFLTVAAMEHERRLRLDQESFKLRLFGERERTDGILRLASLMLQHRLAKVDAAKLSAAHQFDVAKLDVAMRQDKVEHDTEMAAHAQTWDLDLFTYHSQALAALGGASTIPRAQSKRERLAAAVLTSTSAAIQGGMAMRNPAAGGAIGLLTLATQMYGMSE